MGLRKLFSYTWGYNEPMYVKDIFKNHDYSFGVLIWKASKTYNDIKFCKEAKTIIVVDVWLLILYLILGKKVLIEPTKMRFAGRALEIFQLLCRSCLDHTNLI